jgi:tRNA (guanosine-2'-O-)-methyltransferase
MKQASPDKSPANDGDDGRRTRKMEWVLARRQPDLAVVLENVFDPHNIAAVLRTCDAVGVQEVFAITDELPRKRHWGHASSRGAVRWVDVRAYQDLQACMVDVRAKYGCVLGAHIAEGTPDLWSCDLTGSLALVFGNEKQGLSEQMQRLCDGSFIIPQQGMGHSLNISVACGVVLYEAMRQRLLRGMYAEPRLAQGEREAVRRRWSLRPRDGR